MMKFWFDSGERINGGCEIYGSGDRAGCVLWCGHGNGDGGMCWGLLKMTNAGSPSVHISGDRWCESANRFSKCCQNSLEMFL